MKQLYKNKSFLITEYIDKKKSMQEIAAGLGVSFNAVIYWMQKHQIKRRNRSEATYVKRNPKGDPFKIKTNLTDEEKALFYLAIGLYLGEGRKWGKDARVALGNTDPLIIRIFLKFLRDICRADENKIRLELNVYDDVNLKTTLEYWSRITELSYSHFSKPVIRKARGGSYKHLSSRGTLSVVFCNKKLSKIILGWCATHAEIFGGVEKYLYIFEKGRGSLGAKHLHGKQETEGSIPFPGSNYQFVGTVPVLKSKECLS